MSFLGVGAAFATPPGAVISNQATFDYLNAAGQPATITSNVVTVVTGVVRSPASVEFTRVLTVGTGDYQEVVGPSSCFQAGVFQLLADPLLTGGTVIDPTQGQEVSSTSSFNLGEPLFIRLIDSDQNLDYQVIDTAVVSVVNDTSGDTETVQLSETGVDTGVFVGYIPTARGSANSGDCILQGPLDSSVRVIYTDPVDGTDTAQATASLDPVSIVFESLTGAPIDGALVELVDAVTGLPAVVFGNDGVSTFPSQIASGSTVVDSSGASYAFGSGEYRFPVVADGNYRLVITPPPGYLAPSVVSIANLQLLAGAPYALGAESFGAAFTQSGPSSFDVDLPIDPILSALFLQKQTLATTASPGDFVRYELLLENNAAVGAATDITIIDQLPAGVRFVPGSVTINGVTAPDPIMSAGLLTLEFNIAALAVGERVRIFYVVEVIGGGRNDELVNRATAFAAGGLLSNESTASIRLTEDLFRSTGTIIGRVLEADCSQDTFSEEQGVSDIRIYLEDGRYAVTDAGGRFHLEGIDPGTHVAQLDTFTLPGYFDVIGCDATPGYAGSANSQFVRVARGGLHRADFYLLRKTPPEGRIDLELKNLGTDSTEEVIYKLQLNGVGNVAIDNINVMIVLPQGVTYVPNSMRVDGKNLGNPRIMGPAVTLALDPQRAGWTSKIEFVATIDENVAGELVSKATVLFDSPIARGQKTPVAETRMVREPSVVESEDYVLHLNFDVLSDKLAPEDKLQLNMLAGDWQGIQSIEIFATGHTDGDKISARNMHLFADNYVLSQARAMRAALYLAKGLNIPTSNIRVVGRGPDVPVANNATADGRKNNRRVEMVIRGIRRARPSFLEVTQESSGTQEALTVGALPGSEIEQARKDKAAAEVIFVGTPKSQVEEPLEALQPGIWMLLPKKSFQPAIPASKVSIQHAPDQTVVLTINGSPADALNFEATVVNRRQTVAVSRWRTVALQEGKNVLRAVITNADGTPAKTIKRTIYFTGVPTRGVLDLDASLLVADGKTRPVVAVRLFDRSGNVSRPGMVGGYRVNPPYRSWWDVEKERQNELVAIGERESTYRIGADGIALIELEPTTRTGELTLNLKFENGREQKVHAWLKSAARDWILVGFGEGTAGSTTISDNAVAAAAAGEVDGYYDEGRIAFFAKGQIKGEYLLTLAYDTDKKRDDNRDRFNTVIDPNAYYALYADKSEQRFEAASQRKIYVKLERNQFYALFGDLDTGLSVTELSRYERRFNGFKSEFRGSNIGYSVFAAESDQSFVRDELRGDGTSGLYQLSRTPIIANSDIVRIEVRDRFDSGIVISNTTLSRFLDYTLDPLTGTLFFKRPIPSRDTDFNPVYIIAEYETANTSAAELVAGGRGSLRMADDKVEIGITHVTDKAQGAEADLTGVDMRWQINGQTVLRAEFATTDNEVGGVTQSGTAQFIDLQHNGESVDVHAYIREVEELFGMGYQSAADKGFRRLGVDARGKVSEHYWVEGEAAWQQNLQTEDIRNIVRARVRYENESFTATLGLLHAEDKFNDGDTRSSDLAEVGVSKKLLNNKLTLRASASTALGDAAQSIDYPSNFLVGADYRIAQGIDLIAEYEDASGQGIDTTMTRVGVRARPWNRAQINTSLTNEESEFGPRLFANLGLVQGFQLGENWVVDVGVDQTKSIIDNDARVFDPDRELASGSLNQDFLAVYTGAMYSSEYWSANARVEMRDSDVEERRTLLFGWYRAPAQGHGLSAGLTMFTSQLDNGNELAAAKFKFGWAYRKADSKWSFLDRTDLIFDKAVLGINNEKSWRFINNFNANRRINSRAQLSLQYAFKYVRSNFDGANYTGYTDLIGVDFRHGLRERWDVGVNTSIYHSYNSQVLDFGVGVDVGYNLRTNMWLTLGYNFFGFDDKDFAEARYTASGPYLRFSIKADQHLLKRIAGQR